MQAGDEAGAVHLLAAAVAVAESDDLGLYSVIPKNAKRGNCGRNHEDRT
jgi:hypothetical protein